MIEAGAGTQALRGSGRSTSGNQHLPGELPLAEYTIGMPEAGKPKRRWYQYSLRTLFVVVTLCALACSWFVVKMRQAERQHEAVESIEELGGRVFYDYQHGGAAGATPPGPAWLRRLLGDDFAANVDQVLLSGNQVEDADLECLEQLTRLQWLWLDNTRVTDAGLEHLEEVTSLRYLHLTRMNVTEGGIERLRQALPNCEIERRESIGDISTIERIVHPDEKPVGVKRD
jgi:hypothetical protein